MKTFIIDAYEAYTNSDLNEGRGRDVHIGYFTNKTDAEKAGRNEGVMGSDAHVRKILKTINICENYNEYEDMKISDLKKSALQKLTFEERTALGF